MYVYTANVMYDLNPKWYEEVVYFTVFVMIMFSAINGLWPFIHIIQGRFTDSE